MTEKKRLSGLEQMMIGTVIVVGAAAAWLLGDYYMRPHDRVRRFDLDGDGMIDVQVDSHTLTQYEKVRSYFLKLFGKRPLLLPAGPSIGLSHDSSIVSVLERNYINIEMDGKKYKICIHEYGTIGDPIKE